MSPMSFSSTDEWDDLPLKTKEDEEIDAKDKIVDLDGFEAPDENETSRYLYEMMEFNPQKYDAKGTTDNQSINDTDASKESQKTT